MKDLLDEANDLTGFIKFCNDIIDKHPSDDDISKIANAAKNDAVETRRHIVVALLIAKK